MAYGPTITVIADDKRSVETINLADDKKSVETRVLR